MSTDAVLGALQMIKAAVAGGESLAGAVRTLKQLGASPEVVHAARDSYEKAVQAIVEMKDPGALVDKELNEGSWYGGPDPKHLFWPQLESKLQPSLPEAALVGVGNSSNRIVGLMRPPGAPSIHTRGLVLGHVQSGKTTSFMAVAAKSVDVGYRMVIVLSGITDNLRSQTQDRLEEQLVGDLDAKWLKLTDSEHDFQKAGNAAAYLTSTSHKLLAVVKKNPYRLRRLAEWIESAGEAAQLSCPILIIDDEADQASIDVGKSRMSVINELIRRLLLNPKSAYVAYTATPFANLLIDPSVEEGLYPRDFIVPLSAGEDYYGAERLFGRDLLHHVEDDSAADPDDVIRTVEVAEVPKVQPPKGPGAVMAWAPEMAASLRDSVEWFLLATAGRWARGDTEAHSSMLVHTSMLSEAHFRLEKLIDGHVKDLAGRVAAENPEVLDRLEALWLAEVGRVDRKADEAELTWSAIRERLPEVLATTDVIVDNFRSPKRLIYKKDEPSTVIAIGGNTLSRGLTLEGLVSSYFVRAASAYDTLLQMGRWFGYRRGYSDLVRVWMTDELRDWFRDLATVESEIRHEIGRYEAEGLKPSQLAVKIRTHPAMAVTAAAKMRSAVQATIDYSEKREQTILFNGDDKDWLKENWQAASDLLSDASTAPGVEIAKASAGQRYLLRNVPVAHIREFIDAYDFHDDAMRLKRSLLQAYIKEEIASGGLKSWNVIVMSNTADVHGQRQLGAAGSVNLIRRSKMKSSRSGTANIKALAGSSDRASDLSDDARKLLGENPSDAQILALRKKLDMAPLLALYPIARTATVDSKDRIALDAVDDVLGVAFFFPKAAGASAVPYVAADLSSSPVEEPDVELDELDKLDQAAAIESAGVESGETL